MESVASFNSIVTDWLSRLAAWQRGALVQRARRFASLVATASAVELAPVKLEAAGPPSSAPQISLPDGSTLLTIA